MDLKIIELLIVYERGVAKSELPPVIHLLIHVPEAIYRWNSVRNMWCFTNERYNIQTLSRFYLEITQILPRYYLEIIQTFTSQIDRFLGWLKGYIHDRAHSSRNLVNGYARATLSRRMPRLVRDRLLSRLARTHTRLPLTSFLLSFDNVFYCAPKCSGL